MEQCHNSPGSFRCSCTYGHVLAGDGRSCITECPPGYRKRPTATPENSAARARGDECVGRKKTQQTSPTYIKSLSFPLFPHTDVNECQEGRCEWRCVNLPGSHRCICPRGFTLHRDGRRCKGQWGRAHSYTHIITHETQNLKDPAVQNACKLGLMYYVNLVICQLIDQVYVKA